MVRSGPALLLAICMPACAALAQPTFQAEAVSDDRRRGISWSAGAAAIAGGIGLTVDNDFRLSARGSTTRGSARHGGAEAAIDLSASYYRTIGPVRLDATVSSHHFPGGTGSLDYFELGGGASFLIGPADLELFASYAPDQSAIGGDNLYFGARARVAVIGTPVTVIAGIGRSDGDVDDAGRAARLRPGGGYADWRLGLDYVLGPAILGIDYVGTDASRALALSPFADRANISDRLLARASFQF